MGSAASKNERDEDVPDEEEEGQLDKAEECKDDENNDEDEHAESENGEDNDHGDDNAEQAEENDDENNLVSLEDLEGIYEERKISVKNAIKTLNSHEDLFDDNGEIPEDITEALSQIYQASDPPNGISPNECVEFNSEIADMLKKEEIIEMMCQVVHIIYTDEDLDSIQETSGEFAHSLLALQTLTDCSKDVCVAVCGLEWFLETLQQILNENFQLIFKQHEEADWIMNILSAVLSILHSITMHDQCVPEIRNLSFESSLQQYLNSPDNADRLRCIATLAAITNEDECDQIKTYKNILSLLMKLFRKSLDKKSLKSISWSSKECAIVIRLLARNDSNKKLLVDAGCLNLLVELGGNEHKEEDQLESVKTIFSLAFDDENRKTMVTDTELGVIELLVGLKKSNDAEIKKTCDGALLALRAELRDSKKYSKFAQTEVVPSKKSKTKTDDGHIMISYQWDDQEMLKKIKSKLKAAGHKVWMDIDEMEGSTTECMANAVEKADIVLVCMSQKYKDSLNCQGEADYARARNKKIIPLKLEKDYQPDGWLGFICGTKLYYEFTAKYPFETSMAKLLRELGGKNKQTGSKPIRERTTIGTAPSDNDKSRSKGTAHSKQTIMNWTKTDIKDWLEKHKLEPESFDKLTGTEIAAFITLKAEYLETFYRCLAELWQVKDHVLVAKFIRAFDDLSKQLGL